jgi:hypothetical protein
MAKKTNGFVRPSLLPGRSYRSAGPSRHGYTLVEIDPHPDHPGFWTVRASFAHAIQERSFTEYIGKGVRLDHPDFDVLADLFAGWDFRPRRWLRRKASGRPVAANWYLEDALGKRRAAALERRRRAST